MRSVVLKFFLIVGDCLFRMCAKNLNFHIYCTESFLWFESKYKYLCKYFFGVMRMWITLLPYTQFTSQPLRKKCVPFKSCGSPENEKEKEKDRKIITFIHKITILLKVSPTFILYMHSLMRFKSLKSMDDLCTNSYKYYKSTHLRKY